MYKGQLKDFPIEVVEKMLEQQVEQGNKRDVTIFEDNPVAPKYKGGFRWSSSIEGGNFWITVIADKHFETFFKKYPKVETLEQERDRLESRLKEINEQL